MYFLNQNIRFQYSNAVKYIFHLKYLFTHNMSDSLDQKNEHLPSEIKSRESIDCFDNAYILLLS